MQDSKHGDGIISAGADCDAVIGVDTRHVLRRDGRAEPAAVSTGREAEHERERVAA